MKKQNLFFGESYKASFMDIAYKRFMSRQWFCYADVMSDYDSRNSRYGVSSSEGYGELKKYMPLLRKAIEEKAGEGCIEIKGNNRDKYFRYIGKDNDPLVDMRNAKTINDLRTYWEFCQDSAGFFPMSWLEYFFHDCNDLINIRNKKSKGEQVLESSLERQLKNIDLLPFLYEVIKRKKVLAIDYKPFDEEEVTLIFHPHFLKEFNGRWHLYGKAENKEPEFGYAIALDRIVKRPREQQKIEYICAPENYYKDYFKNIVGVSHKPNEEPKEIIIRAHSNYIFKLTDTKPIHKSQETITPFGKHEDGEYGEFRVVVEVNNEFIGRILQMGSGFEVVAPDDVRALFKSRVKELSDRYQ